MTNKNRLITTLIYISSMNITIKMIYLTDDFLKDRVKIMVFVSALVLKEKMLTLLFLIIEICAFSKLFTLFINCSLVLVKFDTFWLNLIINVFNIFAG